MAARVIDGVVPVPIILFLRTPRSQVLLGPPRLNHLPYRARRVHQPVHVPQYLAFVLMVVNVHFRNCALDFLNDGQGALEHLRDSRVQLDAILAPDIICDPNESLL